MSAIPLTTTDFGFNLSSSRRRRRRTTPIYIAIEVRTQIPSRRFFKHAFEVLSRDHVVFPRLNEGLHDRLESTEFRGKKPVEFGEQSAARRIGRIRSEHV